MSTEGAVPGASPAPSSEASFLDLANIVSGVSDEDIKLTFGMHINAWTSSRIPRGGERVPLWVWVQLRRDLLSRMTELTDKPLASPRSEQAQASRTDAEDALRGALQKLHDSATQSMDSSFGTWDPTVAEARGKWTVRKVGSLNKAREGTILASGYRTQFPAAECIFELVYQGDEDSTLPSPSVAGASQPPGSDDSHASEASLGRADGCKAESKGEMTRPAEGDETDREPSIASSTGEDPEG